LFCVYLDGLLQLLAELKVGCTFGEIFVGVLAYADDIVLVAPTANAMRVMLSHCDSYARDFSIVFNANKFKCLFVSARRRVRIGNASNPIFLC
jgi:hypothetical protein